MKSTLNTPITGQTIVTSLSVDDCLGDFEHTVIFTTMSIEYSRDAKPLAAQSETAITPSAR